MSSDPKPIANYISNFFETDDPKRARELILTNNYSMSSEERWEKETPYLTERLTNALTPTSQSILLDFGCGIGRLAKAMIEKHGCQIIGLDISDSMRRMAREHVSSDRFQALGPDDLDRALDTGLLVDHAYAVWVLQHTAHPHDEIRRIYRALKPGGKLYLVNAPGRCVPCDLGWVNDGIDVYTTITELGFREFHREKMAIYPDNNDPSRTHWCVTYHRL